MGEAWYGGPVLISWFDHADDADGINVVIHEFAHKLDMKSGDADGLPPLHAGMSRQGWIDVMNAAFDDFQRRVDGGEETPLDPYGAELPTEFFAVASEAFFETPELLNGEYPGVYGQLRSFYRQDPLQKPDLL
jgi:Mlc titration factor MtfA (ptsG expression regulator)